MQKIIDNKTDKINNQIIKIEKQLKENINYLNSIIQISKIIKSYSK